jgi:hypothetical protein
MLRHRDRLSKLHVPDGNNAYKPVALYKCGASRLTSCARSLDQPGGSPRRCCCCRRCCSTPVPGIGLRQAVHNPALPSMFTPPCTHRSLQAAPPASSAPAERPGSPLCTAATGLGAVAGAAPSRAPAGCWARRCGPMLTQRAPCPVSTPAAPAAATRAAAAAAAARAAAAAAGAAAAAPAAPPLLLDLLLLLLRLAQLLRQVLAELRALLLGDLGKLGEVLVQRGAARGAQLAGVLNLAVRPDGEALEPAAAGRGERAGGGVGERTAAAASACRARQVRAGARGRARTCGRASPPAPG